MSKGKLAQTEIKQTLDGYTEEIKTVLMGKDSIDQAIQRTANEEAQFRKMLPKDGFIGDYMRYTDSLEAPDSYHFWVAATVLGGVIQRRAHLSKGMYSIYAPFYTVLVGPSGITRKSRALKTGMDLLRKYDWANVSADKTTPESMLEAMDFSSSNVEPSDVGPGIQINLDSTIFIAASELAVFINRASYMSGMVSLLTDLYDCPATFKYKTRTKKEINLRNVSVSMLGASTPEWLATNLPEAAFEGGFMSRIMYVVRNFRSRFIAFSEEPSPDMERQLHRHILDIRRYFTGKIELSPEAQGWFNTWYMEHETAPRGHDYNMLGFIARKPDTVLKVAMILCASQNPKNKHITMEHLKQALKIVTWTQERMFRAFENIELSHVGHLRRKVNEMLDGSNGELLRRDVMRKLGGRIKSTNDLAEVERIMAESDELVVDIVPSKSGAGRPKVVYRRPKYEETLEANHDGA